MKTIEVEGDDYELSGNPSMGTVKYVQELQIGILQNYLTDEDIMEMESMDDDDLMSTILNSEGGIDNLKEMMWDNQILDTAQTIILATDHRFDLEEFEKMSALDFKELKEEAEIALGTEAEPQTAADFMESLGLGMSSRLREIQEQAEARVEGSETSSQEALLTE